MVIDADNLHSSHKVRRQSWSDGSAKKPREYKERKTKNIKKSTKFTEHSHIGMQKKHHDTTYSYQCNAYCYRCPSAIQESKSTSKTLVVMIMAKREMLCVRRKCSLFQRYFWWRNQCRLFEEGKRNLGLHWSQIDSQSIGAIIDEYSFRSVCTSKICRQTMKTQQHCAA